jgi:hypothetical protein
MQFYQKNVNPSGIKENQKNKKEGPRTLEFPQSPGKALFFGILCLALHLVD